MSLQIPSNEKDGAPPMPYQFVLAASGFYVVCDASKSANENGVTCPSVSVPASSNENFGTFAVRYM